LEPRLLEVFETAVRYQLAHALGLVLIGALATQRPTLGAAAWPMLAGIVLFCGSLYALALTGVRALGAITPLGGLGFLAGWALLAYLAIRS
jgi:uncharacterized membrane protein YgdD (TMEM256/DUF423 family)